MTRKTPAQTAPADCDDQALNVALDLVCNPTMGRDPEELEAAQALYRLYNSLRYGFKVLLTNFVNDRQYLSVRDQLPPRPTDDSPTAMAAYKEARKRLIYAPVKVAVERYMEDNLQQAGTEAEFLRQYSASSDATMRALIERLLDTAVARYWVELQLNPESEKQQPEMIKIQMIDGRSVPVSEADQRKFMRQCLLRLNQQELEVKQKFNQQRGHKESHIGTVIARGGHVAPPGASNFLVDTEPGPYCVLSLDFHTAQWECLARLLNQQSSFRYADEQRKVAPTGVLIRATRDTQHEFPLGNVGLLQDLRADWRKPLQIPHLTWNHGEPPILLRFTDTRFIEDSWYWQALTDLHQSEVAKFHQAKQAAQATTIDTARP